MFVVIAVLGIGTASFFLLREDGVSGKSDGKSAPIAERSFDFELLSWRCGHESVVTAEEIIKAEGDFCFTAMNVTNKGDTPAVLEPFCQFLMDAEGSRFMIRPEIMALDKDSRAAFGKPVGPGVLIEDSALYYDVPKGTEPVALELHESCGDPGFRLRLDPALEGAET